MANKETSILILIPAVFSGTFHIYIETVICRHKALIMSYILIDIV